MNDPLVRADQEARVEALDTAQSFLVRAPAGAGKTELLIQRFLALLATVKQPEEVLALTFTVKAAGEMRTRILAALDAATGPKPESEHARLTWQLAGAALLHMEQCGWELRDNPSRLRIETIDALCMSLARRMPVLARFGAAPGIAPDSAPLYLRAAAGVLEALEYGGRIAGSIETLLLHLDNDYARTTNLIALMLATRDRWLRHVADREHPSIQRPELETALAALVSEELDALENSVPEQIRDRLPALAASAATRLRMAREDSPIRACEHLDTLPAAAVEYLEEWRGIAELLLTRSGTPRARITVKQGFPAPSGARDAAERKRLTNAKQGMEELLAMVAESPGFIRLLHECRRLPPVRYTHLQWLVFQALVGILPHAVACLKVVFEQERAVDFTEIAHAALRSLGDSSQPTDLALGIDYSIRHLLVDEFQDTSYSQFALLERLTGGWEVEDGRTLFLVGDPMQSIYRFREAEVGLFLHAQEHGVSSILPKTLKLRRNFRSQPAVVDWVNDAFPTLFPVTEDVASGAICYEPVAAARDQAKDLARDDTGDDGVHLHPQLSSDREAEAAQVLQLIQAARHQQPGGTIAVLVRARTHFDALVPALQEAGLPYRAIDLEPLAAVPAVQDLRALTRALLHPAERTAWLAVLRAPWCGLTLADLYALAGDAQGRTIWELVVDEDRRKQLSTDGQRRLSRLKRVLADTLAQRGRRSLRRWVEGTWTALGGPVCVNGVAELRSAERFLGLLEEVAGADTFVDFPDLDNAISRLYASADPLAGDNLQLMTIHRAKGLEFDTVIVPGLGRSPGRSDDPLLMMMERIDRDGDARLLVAPIPARDATDSIYDHLKRLHADCDRQEQTRLLYVAATRARHALHLLGHVPGVQEDGTVRPPAAASLLARLWPFAESTYQQQASLGLNLDAPPVTASALQRRPRSVQRLSSDWLLPPAPQPRAWTRPANMLDPAAGPEFSWAGNTARLTGIAVHKILQQVGRAGLAKWDDAKLEPNAKRLLAELGVARIERGQALERVCAAVRNTLSDRRGRWILDESHLEARSELALAAWLDERLVEVVLDRSFVDKDDVRWIVDFKTGTHEGSDTDAFLAAEMDRYREQLERYARVMQRIDTRTIRVGLYFPLLQEWRDWQP